MKMRKIAMSIALVLVMVSVMVLGVVACNKEEPVTKLDLKSAEHWGPASSDPAEANMIKATNSGDNLVINYTDKKEWTGIAKTLTYEKADVLKVMKTLVVKAKLTTDNIVNPSMFFKMDVLNKQAEVKASATEITYEWDVSALDLTKETWFIIFPDAGVASATGTITISEIYLTVDPVNAANDVSKYPIVSAEANPAAPVWQEITANSATIGGWVDGSGYGTYDVDEDDGVYTVNVDRKVGTGQWTAAISYIYGEASVMATMQSFKIKVKGEQGQAILVKPFDSHETRIEFNGQEQEVIIDIVDTTEVGDNDYSQKDAPTNLNKVAIIALPGLGKGETSFDIISAEFSTQEAPDAGIKYGGEQNLNFNARWRDSGDGKWETEVNNEGIWTLSYEGGHGWASATTKLKLGSEVMNYVVVEIKAPNNVPYLLKFGGKDAFEKTGTGEFVKIAMPIDAITGNVQVLVFADWDGSEDGEIQIKSAMLYHVAGVAEDDKDLDINVAGAFGEAVKGSTRNVISYEDGKIIVSYTEPNWNSIITYVDLGEGGFDTFTLEFTGGNGHTAIISINGTEKKYEGINDDEGTFTGEKQTITLDVSNLEGLIFIRIFLDMNPNDVNAEGGTFEISKAVFSRAAA